MFVDFGLSERCSEKNWRIGQVGGAEVEHAASGEASGSGMFTIGTIKNFGPSAMRADHRLNDSVAV